MGRSDLLTLRNVTAALEKELHAKRHSEPSKGVATTPNAEFANSPQSANAKHGSQDLTGDGIEDNASASKVRTNPSNNAARQHPLASLPTPCRNGFENRPRGNRAPTPPVEPVVLARTSSMQVVPH